MSSAPAIAASGQPAFLDRCFLASLIAVLNAFEPFADGMRKAATDIIRALNLAGIKFARSSNRAEHQPK